MTVRHATLALLLLAGCKSADKGGPLGLGVFGSKDATPTGSQRAAVDPLLTNGRIPPQNVPVPGKDQTVDATRDPLLGSPAVRDGGTDRPERASANPPRTPPRPGGETSSLPRVSVPFRPGRQSTPAALAARIDPRDPAYKVGDDDPPPVLLVSGKAERSADDLLAELKRLKATVARPVLEKGEYVARGEVELDPVGRPGERRAYEAAGPSREAALAGLLEQVRGDLRR